MPRGRGAGLFVCGYVRTDVHNLPDHGNNRVAAHKGSAYKRIPYLFTFPFFMATYIPISVVALLKKVEWKPIEHTAAITLDDLNSKDGK